MFYKSFLELALEEKALCDEIQLKMNILDAAHQVELEGRDTSRHGELLRAAGRDMALAMPELRRVRAEMGGKLMMYEELATKSIQEHLTEPGGDGQ